MIVGATAIILNVSLVVNSFFYLIALSLLTISLICLSVYLSVYLSVCLSVCLSDTEMIRMGELDRIAEMGSEDEKLLHR